ncbi:MAG TPA: trypsin-like peptidase domain-containing protein [Armatimonadota bacterium]
MSHRTNWAGILFVSLLVGLVGGLGGAYLYARYAPSASGPVLGASTATPRVVSVDNSQSAIVQAAAKASPAVVTITATSQVAGQGPFGMFGAPQMRRSLGSGFFFEQDGKRLILTNSHVIAGADKLTVHMIDGTVFDAKIVGASPMDVAVLEPIKGPAHPPALALGDSDTIPVGSWVIAVGSPFGFDNTVTVGVVSRKGYTQVGENDSRYLIQTDTAINSGNSGGPLIDLGANVIGINEMIFSPTQTNLGIGWAIPVNEVKQLMSLLINGGPWIGVATLTNSAGLARALGLAADTGVVLMKVSADSPAAKAGLRAGDVVMQADGAAVKTADELTKAILKHRIGDQITMTVQRGREQLAAQVEAGKVPANMR